MKEKRGILQNWRNELPDGYIITGRIHGIFAFNAAEGTKGKKKRNIHQK